MNFNFPRFSTGQIFNRRDSSVHARAYASLHHIYRQTLCKTKLVLLCLDNSELSYLASVNSVYNGTELLSHLAPKIWELVLNDIKALEPLSEFKNSIKLWKPIRYH